VPNLHSTFAAPRTGLTSQIEEKSPSCYGFHSSFGRSHYSLHFFEEQESEGPKAKFQGQDELNVFRSLPSHIEAEEFKVDPSTSIARAENMKEIAGIICYNPVFCFVSCGFYALP
jgi:hypothetical protein